MTQIETEMKNLKGKSEGFKNGVKVALTFGGKKKSVAATYYEICREKGADWAEGFEYGLLLAVRLLESMPQMQPGGRNCKILPKGFTPQSDENKYCSKACYQKGESK